MHVLSRIVEAVSSAGHRFVVSVAGEAVRVRSDDASADHVCEYVFGPQAQVLGDDRSGSSAASWTVATLASDSVHEWGLRLATLRSAARRTGSPLSSYWRDDHDAESLVRSPEVTAIRHTAPFSALTLFVPPRRLLLYIRRASERMYVPHLEHLIGYTLRVGCWRRGFLDVHAALVQYRGRGLILSGRRRAGKTSLAMHLLRRGGVLLGSDLGVLHSAPGAQVVARAIPHLCRITPETVADDPLLRAALGSSDIVNANYLRGPVFSGGKFELYATALDEVFGRKVHIRSMQVDGIVFPRFERDARRQQFKSLAPVSGIRRLLNSIETDRPAADWLPFAEVLERERYEKQAKQNLAARAMGAVEFTFGQTSSLEWSEIDEVIDAL